MANTVKRRKAYKEAKLHRRYERTVVNHREHMIARATPIEDLPNVDPAETMQLLINRVERQWRYAAAQVDALKPGVPRNQSPESMDHELWVTWDDNGNLVVTASYWMQREKELSELLGRLTESAQKVGLADRLVRAKESQVRILGEALRAACIKAGLDELTQQRLGSQLRQELIAIEGSAVEIEAA